MATMSLFNKVSNHLSTLPCCYDCLVIMSSFWEVIMTNLSCICFALVTLPILSAKFPIGKLLPLSYNGLVYFLFLTLVSHWFHICPTDSGIFFLLSTALWGRFTKTLSSLHSFQHFGMAKKINGLKCKATRKIGLKILLLSLNCTDSDFSVKANLSTLTKPCCCFFGYWKRPLQRILIVRKYTVHCLFACLFIYFLISISTEFSEENDDTAFHTPTFWPSPEEL